MAKLTSPSGVTVSVADGKVDELLRRGFTPVEEKKAPAKKTASPRKTTTSK